TTVLPAASTSPISGKLNFPSARIFCDWFNSAAPLKVRRTTSPGAKVTREGGAAWLEKFAPVTVVSHPAKSHVQAAIAMAGRNLINLLLLDTFIVRLIYSNRMSESKRTAKAIESASPTAVATLARLGRCWC